MDYAYVLFENATDGMLLHKTLKSAGIRAEICPTPRHLAKSCGIALRFDPLAENSIRDKAKEISVPIVVVSKETRSCEDSVV